MKFSDFNFQPELLQALEEMGYEAPTPIQAQTIPLLLEAKDVIGCARTGSGKTAAFALPVLNAIEGGQQNPQVLVIAPTRELAEQIRIAVDDYAKHLPVKCVAIYGGASSRLQEAQLDKGVDVVIATPGRLLDMLQRSAIRLYDVKYLILDEADRMLDMGFVPDIEEIMTFLPRKRQTLLFSATMPDAIKKLAFSLTKDAEMIRIGIENAASDSVEQSVMMLSPREKEEALMHIIQHHDIESMIVFARTKTGADKVAKTLIQNHVAATCIHSNRTQSQRQSALEAFRNGEYKVLVATDVAARGIDVSHISHVVNYDTPTHAEDYVHRVGRTGRAGAKGVAFTFTSSTEKKYLRDIEKLIGNSLDVVTLKQAQPQTAKAKTAKTQDTQATETKAIETKTAKKTRSKAKASSKKAADTAAVDETLAPSAKATQSEKPAQKAKASKTKTRKTKKAEDAQPAEAKTEKASRGKKVDKTEKAVKPAKVESKAKIAEKTEKTEKTSPVKSKTPARAKKTDEKLSRRNANASTSSRRRSSDALQAQNSRTTDKNQSKRSEPKAEVRDRTTSRRRKDVVVNELPTPRFKPEQNDNQKYRKKRHTHSVIQAEPRMSESYAFYRNPEDELDYLDFKPEVRSQGEDPMKTYNQQRNRSRRSSNSRGRGRSNHSRQRSR